MNSIDYLRILVYGELLVIAILYGRTAYRGFRHAYESEARRYFNLGRACSSLAVVILNFIIADYMHLFWGQKLSERLILTTITQILLLFGWFWSVRITLKDGHPDD